MSKNNRKKVGLIQVSTKEISKTDLYELISLIKKHKSNIVIKISNLEQIKKNSKILEMKKKKRERQISITIILIIIILLFYSCNIAVNKSLNPINWELNFAIFSAFWSIMACPIIVGLKYLININKDKK